MSLLRHRWARFYRSALARGPPLPITALPFCSHRASEPCAWSIGFCGPGSHQKCKRPNGASNTVRPLRVQKQKTRPRIRCVNSNMDTPAPAVKGKRALGGDRDPVQVGQILNRAQVIRRAKISPNTLKKWERMGLQMYEPPGKVLTTGDDVLAFVKRFPIVQPEAKQPVPKKRKRKE